MPKNYRKSVVCIFLLQFFVCFSAKSNPLAELLDRIEQNPTALQIDQAEKRQIELFYRAKPGETLAIIKSFRTKGLHIPAEVNHYLLEIETISNYNLGNLNKAIQHNDTQLNNLQYFQFELADSLGILANRMILFYTTEQPINALSFGIQLEKKLSAIPLNEKTIRLHKLLATIYGLLGFEKDAFRVLESTIDKLKNEGLQEFLGDFYVVKAFELLKNGAYENVLQFATMAQEYINHQPFLNRRIYAALANYHWNTGDLKTANDYFIQAFEAYQEFPDVISASQVLSEYAKFMHENSAYQNASFLSDGLSYLKKFDSTTHLNFHKNNKSIALILLGWSTMTPALFEEYKSIVDEIAALERQIFQNQQSFLSQNLHYHLENELQKAAIQELTVSKEKTELQNRWYITIAAICLMLLLSSLYFVKQYRKNQSIRLSLEQQSKRLAEEQLAKEKAEKEMLAIEQLRMKDRLDMNIAQIEKYKGVLSRMDNLIAELKKTKSQDEIIRTTQIYQNEFKEYLGGVFETEIRKDFKKNSPKKYEILVQKIGNEQSYEFLYAILVLLGFNTKEISTSLNKSEKAIRSIRYRLRKLLDLERDKDLFEALNEV